MASGVLSGPNSVLLSGVFFFNLGILVSLFQLPSCR